MNKNVNTKMQLLEAAKSVFAKKGFENFTSQNNDSVK